MRSTISQLVTASLSKFFECSTVIDFPRSIAAVSRGWSVSQQSIEAVGSKIMNSPDSAPFRAPLNDEDFFALNAVKARTYSFVTKARIERLIAVGLVKESLAGLRLTDAGEVRVAAQK